MTTDEKVSQAAGPGRGAQAPRGVHGWVLRSGVERALRAQHSLVTAHIAAVHRKRPNATPAQVIADLGRQYQGAVTVTGGAAGALAIAPVMGTVASLATATVEAFAALDAAVLYTLAVAEVHALPTEDPERRRAIVLGVVLGDSGEAVMRKVTGRSRDWAGDIADHLPLAKIGPLNNSMTRWFVKRFVIRQSLLAFGRALPLGIGLVVGGVGNLVTAKAVIRAAEHAFGSPPTEWPHPGGPLSTRTA